MPNGTDLGQFMRIGAEDFALMIEEFSAGGSRKINEVHLHHTFVPDYNLYDRLTQNLGGGEPAGAECVRRMWNYHVNELGWRDIAQHLTIDPDGGPISVRSSGFPSRSSPRSAWRKWSA